MKNNLYTVIFKDGSEDTEIAGTPMQAAIKQMAKRIDDAKNWEVDNVEDEKGATYSIEINSKKIF